MTALGRFFRKVAEKLAGTYYEGPDAPPRLRDEVRVFAALNPEATAADWREFAAHHAEQAYTDGFTRGLEWNERLWPGPATDPEVLAEQEAHTFSLPEHYLQQLEQHAPPSPIAGMTHDQAMGLQHQLAHVGARIVPVPVPEPAKRR